MTPTEAAKILELPADATPEQLEARFLEVRTKFEDKIAKAPTPGLKAKYRESLEEITTAFETLTLAADSSALPVLQRGSGVAGSATVAGVAAPGASSRASASTQPGSATPATTPPPRSARKSGGGWEFLIVAVIAIAVLGAGGWWIMKTRIENAEKERVAAAAKVETERQAKDARLAAEVRKKAEEAEQERQEHLFAQLRATQAEQKIRWESFEKDLATAERKLGEWKSDLRNTKDLPATQTAELRAQFGVQGDYVDWLQPYLANHPGKAQLAKLDALLSAKAMDAAATVAEELAQSLAAATAAIAENKKNLLTLTGPVQLTSEPAGLVYTLSDAYGRSAQGNTPFDGELPLGALAVKIQRGSGWADYEKKSRVKRSEPLAFHAIFGHGKLEVTSSPAGLPFQVKNTAGFTQSGTTPAELAEVPGGEVSVRVTRKDWPDVVQAVQVPTGGSQTVLAEFSPGTVDVTSTPSGAEIWTGDKKLGVTPLTITNQIPGKISGELRLKRYRRVAVEGKVWGKQTLRLSAMLEKLPEGEPEHGETLTIPDLDLTLIGIRQGSFQMGDNSGEASDKPVHTVTISRPFWLGKYEVTQAEWVAIMGAHPGMNAGSSLPAGIVSWDAARSFCLKLTDRERAAGRLPEGWEYTLPTEAQWEYACRAGSRGAYAGTGSLDDMGWYADNSGNTSHPVGQKRANAWGFYDMHGNVLEWCADWHGAYAADNLTDPTGADSGSMRVLRGGSWGHVAAYHRSARHLANPPFTFNPQVGFRLALSSVR